MNRFVKVKVEADARESSILPKGKDAFRVRVTEPAENGRANKAVLQLLAGHLGVAVGKLWIVKGARSPAKIVEVRA